MEVIPTTPGIDGLLHKLTFFSLSQSQFLSRLRTIFQVICLRCGSKDGHRAHKCTASGPTNYGREWVSSCCTRNWVQPNHHFLQWCLIHNPSKMPLVFPPMTGSTQRNIYHVPIMAFPGHFCSGILLRPFVASYMFGVLSSLFPEVLRYLYLSGPFVAPLYFEGFCSLPYGTLIFPRQ